MVNECVVAVDIGTQSTRAALVDVSGAVLDSASSPIESLWAASRLGRAGPGTVVGHDGVQHRRRHGPEPPRRGRGRRGRRPDAQSRGRRQGRNGTGRPVCHLERQALRRTGRRFPGPGRLRRAFSIGGEQAAARLVRLQDGLVATLRARCLRQGRLATRRQGLHQPPP